MSKCEICHQGPPEQSIAVYRVNPVGEAGIWRCWDHLTASQRGEVDPEVKKITDIIGRGSEPAPYSQAGIGGCAIAGPGRGDCAHFIGLPGVSIPGRHDGPDDTLDCYGKPNGWCWVCWLSHKAFLFSHATRHWSHQEQIEAINRPHDPKYLKL